MGGVPRPDTSQMVPFKPKVTGDQESSCSLVEDFLSPRPPRSFARYCHLQIAFTGLMLLLKNCVRFSCPSDYRTHSPPPPWVKATPLSSLSWPSRCSGRVEARGEEGGRTARMREARLPPTTSTGKGCTRRLSEESKTVSQARVQETN